MEDRSLSMSLAIYGFYQKPRKVEPAGISYEFLQVCHSLTLGLPTAPVYNPPPSKQSGDQENGDDWERDAESPQYLKYIASLDPKHSKEQDHYKVLGLSKLRHQATPHQIRLAYRQKVLKFHPDKGSVKLETTEENARNEEIFACIQKAYELGISEKERRAYDSVDPKFDESIPEKEQVNAENFFEILGPIFERNARFSNYQPVPLLGDRDSSRSDVEEFYDFWYNWSSWRDFSYLDAEDTSKGEDRYERREIKKANKTEREKLKKKDFKRITSLVEMTYLKDPRVAKFKEEERRAKEALKEQKRLEREQKERERRQREEEEIQQAGQKLQTQGNRTQPKAQGKDAKCTKYRQIKEDQKLELPLKTGQVSAAVFSTSTWSPEELKLLVKAVGIYPPGTNERWKMISQYVTLHGAALGGSPRGEKETIKQARSMESADPSSAQATRIKETEPILSEIKPNTKPTSKESTWTMSQHRQLESALRSISSTDPERWDKIAASVDGKSKKDCMRRYKELVEMVKAKNTAKKE